MTCSLPRRSKCSSKSSTGKVRAFGVTQKLKMPEFSHAESMAELLGPNLEIDYWQALFAPSPTPAAIVNKLNAELEGVVTDPAILKIHRRVSLPKGRALTHRRPQAAHQRDCPLGQGDPRQ